MKGTTGNQLILKQEQIEKRCDISLSTEKISNGMTSTFS